MVWLTSLALAALLSTAPGTSGQDVTWMGSFEAANGDYLFTERTTSFYLMNGLGVRLGAFRVSAHLPIVLQDNPVVARVGSFPLPTGGERHGELRGRGGSGNGQGGAGALAQPSLAPRPSAAADPIEIDPAGSYELYAADPLLGASADLEVAAGPIRFVTISVSAKAPINDVDSGIGTGAWDAGAGLGLTLDAGPLIVLLDATYWSFGDLPELALQDAVAYGAAIGGGLGDGPFGWSVSALGTTEIVDGVDPPVSLGADLLISFAGRRSLRAGFRFGLTESASDISGSFGWTLPIIGAR